MALKSREYEDRVKSMGFERATRMTLMELIEQHNVLEKTLLDYAISHDKMMDIFQAVVGMGEQLKSVHQEIQAKLGKNVPEDAPFPNDDRFEEK